MRPGGSTPDRVLVTPSTPRRVTRAGKRAGNLERRFIPGSGGSYVFLAEQIVATDGDPLLFTAISQDYRHLVLEVSLRVYFGATQAAFIWNGDDSAHYSMGWIKVDSGDTITGEAQSDSYTGVTVPDINDDSFTDPVWTQITAKFGYYSLASRVKSCVWQATSIGEDGTLNGAYSSGGGQSVGNIDSGQADVDPITSLEIIGSHGPLVDSGCWAADSRASLYGIT